MTLGLNDFRCQIFRRPAQRPRSVLELFGEPKVGNFQMSVPIEQQVLRLQVPIDDLQLVKVLQREHNFARVKVCGPVVKPTRVPEVRKQLATAHVLKQHVQTAVVLGVPSPGNEEGKLIFFREIKSEVEYLR